MSWNLFLDDERSPVGDRWMIARSSQAAIKLVQENGVPQEVAFDHDLGDQDTSMQFIWWLIDEHYDGNLNIPEGFKYTIHSQNPVGAGNIKGLMDGFLRDIGRLE